MSEPTVAELAYAAGFFDGEGSVMLMKGQTTIKWRPSVRVSISVAQVDRRPLDWLAGIFGGSVSPQCGDRTRKRQAFRWTLCGGKSVAFLRQIRPYLVLKAPQADLAFEFYKTVPPKGGIITFISDEVLEKREAFRQQMKMLNQRGVLAS